MTLAEPARPDPDTLLARTHRESRGRLRIYLGAAPGVGKTWEMLNAARRRREAGTDVLAGIIETHGRAETEAAIGDLPILPRKDIDYNGRAMPEFDIDAALARRPALLLVDELAHSNVPGSRHAKRWEDVTELLDAGIDVWATLNVQHIESLNDTVARITGVRVSETLPDKVLEDASEIELVDVTSAELRTRLADGRIYRPDIARRALGGFFREGNLGALREIALRRAAQHVDADVRDYMRANAIAGPWPSGERILAVIVGNPLAAEAAVRHAKMLSDGLHAPFDALLVETRPGDALALARVVALARELGAEVETRAGAIPDEVGAVVRARNVTQVVIGRAPGSRLGGLGNTSLRTRLVRALPDVTLVVAAASPGQIRRAQLPIRAARRLATARVADVALPVGVAAIVTLGGEASRHLLDPEALGMVFLGGVVLAATFRGLIVGLVTALLSFLAWNFFFIPPVYQLTIDEPRDVVAILVFAGVAVSSGLLAERLRRAQQAAQSRVDGLRRIGGFSRALGVPTTEAALLDEIARQAATACKRSLVLTARGEDLDIAASDPPADTMDDGSWAAARWAAARAEETGRGTATLPSAAWRFLPMRTARGLRGVLGVQPEHDGFDATTLQTLLSLADQAAVALERTALAAEAARAEAGAETQRLRTALLNSLSHDLRTPLAGIQGAAGTLRGAWTALPDATRTDLLASIEEDTQRMARFLGNIMDMTRLESGQIAPRVERVELALALDAALARVPAAHVGARTVEPTLAVSADAALLEQVLVNVLDNAARYAPPDAPIGLRATTDGTTVSLTIADEGVGIAPDEIEAVFDSFYRARRGDRAAPGTGLGLAIARGLTEAMGGTIGANSPRARTTNGKPGTEITLRLPAAQ
jgi:two-component system sensor histidine kinase KdpD